MAATILVRVLSFRDLPTETKVRRMTSGETVASLAGMLADSVLSGSATYCTWLAVRLLVQGARRHPIYSNDLEAQLIKVGGMTLACYLGARTVYCGACFLITAVRRWNATLPEFARQWLRVLRLESDSAEMMMADMEEAFVECNAPKERKARWAHARKLKVARLLGAELRIRAKLVLDITDIRNDRASIQVLNEQALQLLNLYKHQHPEFKCKSDVQLVASMIAYAMVPTEDELAIIDGLYTPEVHDRFGKPSGKV